MPAVIMGQEVQRDTMSLTVPVLLVILDGPFVLLKIYRTANTILPQVTQDQPIIVPNLSIIHRIIPELIPFHPHNLLGLPTTMDLQKSGLN